MNVVKYIKEKGVRHFLDTLINYKVNELIMKCMLLIYKKRSLKDIIIIGGHNDFDSNGGALYDFLIKHNYNQKYKIVWFLRNKHHPKTPDNVECVFVKGIGIRKAYYRVNAKFIITCHDVMGSCREGQISVYLTHGPVALKGFKGKCNLPKELTYCLCPSEFMKPILADQYMLDYPNSLQIILGYPCHDCFFDREVGDLKKLVNHKYNKVILWMPTFRQNYTKTRIDSTREFNLGIPIFKSMHELEKINQMLKVNNSLLIIKIHPMQDLTKMKVIPLSNIKILDGHSVKKLQIDNYKLMKDTDALISDYSSVAYDYLHLNRPIAYTMDDANDYKLGFIVDDPYSLMAGHVIKDEKDFGTFLEDVFVGRDIYKEKRKELYDKVFQYHDGNSTQRLIDFLKI